MVLDYNRAIDLAYSPNCSVEEQGGERFGPSASTSGAELNLYTLQPCYLRPSVGVRLSQSSEVREAQATQQGLWNELRDVPAAKCLDIGGRGAGECFETGSKADELTRNRYSDNYELLVVDSSPAVELEGWRATIPALGGGLAASACT